MDQAKTTTRDLVTETKKGIRDLDGHTVGDDVQNVKDEVGKDVANVGDELHRTGHDVATEIDHEVHEER